MQPVSGCKCPVLNIAGQRCSEFELIGAAQLHYFLLCLPGLLSLGLMTTLQAQAASALAAWALGIDGTLQLRTTTGTQLEAFYQAARDGRGPRVWIDFPGELVRPRTLQGSGAVREIRLGKPSPGLTRLVIEFTTRVRLNPKNLKLVGTAPDRWSMLLAGLPTRGLRHIGEGNLEKNLTAWAPGRHIAPSRVPVNPADLPNVLSNRYRVVVDPGHGGPDPGAIGIGGLRETDVVLDISLQVADLLKNRGVYTTLTRTSDIDVDLPPRVSIANQARATVFVSIHVNAISMLRPDVNGIETFYHINSSSARLASYIHQRVLDVSSGSPNRGVRQGRFFVIRRTTMPSALVETGFVTGQLDAPRLASGRHRRRLALAIAAGILSYLREVR